MMEEAGGPRVASVQRQLLSSVQNPHCSVFMTADGGAVVGRLVRDDAAAVTLVVKSVSRTSFSLETSLMRSGAVCDPVRIWTMLSLDGDRTEWIDMAEVFLSDRSPISLAVIEASM